MIQNTRITLIPTLHTGVAIALLTALAASRPVHAQTTCSSATPMGLRSGSLEIINAMSASGAAQPYFWNSNLFAHNIYMGFVNFDTDPLNWRSIAPQGLAESQVGYGMGGTKWLGTSSQYYGYDMNFSGGVGTFVPTLFNHADLLVTAQDFHGLSIPPPPYALSETQVAQVADQLWNSFSQQYSPGSVNNESIIYVMLPPGYSAAPANPPAPPNPPCARHGVSSQGHLYAWVQYPTTTNPLLANCSTAGQEASIMHEYQETITDPLTWWNNSNPIYTSWVNQNNACEMGDACGGYQFDVQPQPGSRWRTQEFFSNEAFSATGNGCVYGRTTNAFVFALGIDNNLYETPILADTPGHTVTSHAPVLWGSPPGVTLSGTPGAASWGPGRLDVFVNTSPLSGIVEHGSVQNSGEPVSGGAAPVIWQGLQLDGAKVVQSPDAVSWGAGNIQVFTVAKGASGNPFIARDSMDVNLGNWTGFQSIAGPPGGVYPVSKVAVSSFAASSYYGLYVPVSFPQDYRTVLAVFRGSDGNLWYGTSVNYGAFNWSSLGHPIANATGDPEINVYQPTSITSAFSSIASIEVMDTSGQGWSLTSSDGATFPTVTKWLGPTQGAIQGGPAAVGMGDGRVLIAARIFPNPAPGEILVSFGAFNAWTSWSILTGFYNSGVELVAW